MKKNFLLPIDMNDELPPKTEHPDRFEISVMDRLNSILSGDIPDRIGVPGHAHNIPDVFDIAPLTFLDSLRAGMINVQGTDGVGIDESAGTA